MLSVHSSYCQVTSQYLTVDIDNLLELDYKSSHKKHNLQSVNFEKVLEEDQIKNLVRNRIAVKVKTAFDKSHGEISEFGDTIIWSLRFQSPKARFLMYMFSETNLPEGSEMYIYSPSKNFLQGPIIPINITEGVFISDIIEGKSSEVIVKMTKENFDNFEIKIPFISQGIPKGNNYREWKDAGDCHFDVNCSLGNGYEEEADATGLFIDNMEDLCSGSLINNECYDLTLFFLTANHCVGSGIRQVNPSIAMFKFNFEANSPQCPGKSTGSQSSWFTFSGSTEKASHIDTDFSLLEINGSLLNLTNQQKENIALAGWDRSITPATSARGIHHPEGDAKKVSSYIIDAESIDGGGAGLDSNFHWLMRLDQGKVEGGSSGSPLFDQNKRIVGQLEGSSASCDPAITSRLVYYGRLNKSWTGGFTHSTQLSHWLGDSNPAMAINSIRIPYIDNSNDDPICTTNRTVPLKNPIAARSTSWSVSPSNLVAVSSGSGANASIRAKDSNSAGIATLTYNLTRSGCDPITLSTQLHIGKPSLFSSSSSGQSPVYMVVSAAGSATTYNWTKVTGSGNIYPYNNTCNAYPSSTMVVNVTATNICGTKSIKDFYLQTGGGYGSILINNPTNDYVYLDLQKLRRENLEIRSIKIIDLGRREVLTDNSIDNNLRRYSFNISNEKPGTYFILIETNESVIFEKLLKM